MIFWSKVRIDGTSTLPTLSGENNVLTLNLYGSGERNKENRFYIYTLPRGDFSGNIIEKSGSRLFG